MPRYEISEGSSSKFWEIELSGKSFTTTYGKVGTNGQSSTKTFKTEVEAKKEYEKLIAEKTKKGYELAGDDDLEDDEDEDFDDDDDFDEDDDLGDDDLADEPKSMARPAGAGGGARYFELGQGGAAKFWEIRLVGESVTTRYGKVGADGQKTVKEFDTVAQAKKEYDKLVAEKIKKGYAEKKAGASAKPAAKAAATNAVVVDDDDDEDEDEEDEDEE